MNKFIVQEIGRNMCTDDICTNVDNAFHIYLIGVWGACLIQLYFTASIVFDYHCYPVKLCEWKCYQNVAKTRFIAATTESQSMRWLMSKSPQRYIHIHCNLQINYLLILLGWNMDDGSFVKLVYVNCELQTANQLLFIVDERTCILLTIDALRFEVENLHDVVY